MNHHKVVSRYWVIWSCRARKREADRPEKAWPMLFPWIEKTENCWPKVRGFQTSLPWLKDKKKKKKKMKKKKSAESLKRFVGSMAGVRL